MKKFILLLISLFLNCGLFLVEDKSNTDKEKSLLMGALAFFGVSTSSSALAATTSSPPAIAFGSSSYTFTKDLALSVMPITSGTITSCTANPSLPVSLQLGQTNCVLSGLPTVAQASASYTITATNSVGSSSTTIAIEVKAIPPSALVYSSTSLTLNVNSTMTTLVPTYNGSITSCASSPTLPSGLSLDATTCTLSGTPTAIKILTGYTITATNSEGSTTANINITVLPEPPSGLSYAGTPFTFTQNLAIATISPTLTGVPTTCTATPSLPSGLSISTICTISGTPSVIQSAASYTILATNGGGSSSTSISITVNVAPPSNLVYSGSPYTMFQNASITTITPTITGTPTSCTASPTLPAGLLLNASSCAISGAPNNLQANTSYTITASNSSGNTNATISITVNAGVCRFDIDPSLYKFDSGCKFQ